MPIPTGALQMRMFDRLGGVVSQIDLQVEQDRF